MRDRIARQGSPTNSDSASRCSTPHGGAKQSSLDHDSDVEPDEPATHICGIGSLQCDWIGLLTLPHVKKVTGREENTTFGATLPSHLVPKMGWQSLELTKSSCSPSGRFGHTMLPVERAPDSSSTQVVGQLIYVIGGISGVREKTQTKRSSLLELPNSPQTLTLPNVATFGARVSDGGQMAPRMSKVDQSISSLWQSLTETKTGYRSICAPTAAIVGHTNIGVPVGAAFKEEKKDQVESGGPKENRLRKAKKNLGSLTAVGRSLPRTSSRNQDDSVTNAVGEGNYASSGHYASSSAPKLQVEWHHPHVTFPSNFVSSVACVLHYGLSVVIFGGLQVPSTDLQENDTPVSVRPTSARRGATVRPWQDAMQDASSSGKDGANPSPVMITRKLHVLDVAKGTWRDETHIPGGPPACYEHAAAVVSGGREMLVHGGCTCTELPLAPVEGNRHGTPRKRSERAQNTTRASAETTCTVPHDQKELKTLDMTFRMELMGHSVRWKQVQDHKFGFEGFRASEDHGNIRAKIPARRAHSITIVGAKAYLLGGLDQDGNLGAGIRILDLDREEWFVADGAGVPPVQRAYHSATLLGPYIAIFGGIGKDGKVLRDLRLLHLPTLIWIAPKPVEQIGEPSPRATHGATALTIGTKPGQFSLLVFGGWNAGDFLKDMHILSVKPPVTPSERHEHPQQNSEHCDVGFQYVYQELQAALENEEDEFDRNVRQSKRVQRDVAQEIRNHETRSLGERTKSVKYNGAVARAAAEELDVQCLLEAELDQWDTSKTQAKKLLRDLEIEMESLRARVSRLQGETVHVAYQLFEPEDIEITGVKHQQTGVRNPLCPSGFIDRLSARWCGANVSAEVITVSGVVIDHGNEGRDQASQKGRTAVVGVDISLEVPLRTSSKNIQASETLTQGDTKWNIWSDAVKSELRIMKLLKHPHIQEVYGATMDRPLNRLILLVQPLTRTLAELLQQPARPASKEPRTQAKPRPSFVKFSPSSDQLGNGLGSNNNTPTNQQAKDKESSKTGITENDRFHISCDVTSALDYLHCKGVAHRHLIPDNVFIIDSVSLGAKLGGHFASRVSCRARNESIVVGKDSGLPSSLPERAGQKKNQRSSGRTQSSSVDSRPADILSLGLLLLRLWYIRKKRVTTGCDTSKFKGDLNCDDDEDDSDEDKSYHEKSSEERKGLRTKSEPLTGSGTPINSDDRRKAITRNTCAVHNKQQKEAPWDSEFPDLDYGVRDDSVRFVIRSCLYPDEFGRLPSARVVQRLFVESQLVLIDSTTLQHLTITNDPSKESTLVDLAMDDDVGEHLLLGSQEESLNVQYPESHF